MTRFIPFLLLLSLVMSHPAQAASKKKHHRPAKKMVLLDPVPEPLPENVLLPDCSQKKKDKLLKVICKSLTLTQKEEDVLNKVNGIKDEPSVSESDDDVHKGAEPQVRIKIGRRILIVSMEEYLAGVIGNEMNIRWPKEALKAQAVAARSYAIYGMLVAQKNGRHYDLETTQADQVFRVRESKEPYLRDLVSETRGQVLTMHGKVVQAFYSSTCGGSTRSAVEAGLGKNSPLTKTSKDSYCEISPFRNWTVALTLPEIEKRLRAFGIEVKNLKTVRIKTKDKAGYAVFIELKDENGSQQVKAWSFRSALGYMRIKSVLFNLTQNGQNVTIHGHGFGHGVGLCQFGAKAMAEKHKNYRTILMKYYPKSSITKWY